MKPTILVVDDTPLNIDVLKNLLQGQYTVRPAINGELALRLALIDPLPSLILLDIMMPGIDGYEVCQRLKANSRTAHIPIIFITAESNAGSEVKGLELGAVDFISKPIVPPVVLARVSTHLSLQATRRELEEKNFQLGEEKEMLEEIITRMHSTNPVDMRHIRYIQRSLDKMAGDIMLSGVRPDGTHHLMVGDFSGHGLPAALGGILTPYIFYRMTAHGFNMEAILNEINRVLYQQLPTQLYMAGAAIELLPDSQRANVWNYGLPPLFYLSDNTRQEIPSCGLPMGIAEGVEDFKPHLTLNLSSGERLYMYSDGLTEATAPDNKTQFGQENLAALVQNIHDTGAPLEIIWQELDKHCSGKGLGDDAIMAELSF